MAYDEGLAQRIRETLGDDPRFTEKKMFGGVAFMASGHMFCGVVKSDLMVRVGPAQDKNALAKPHARPMDFTGKPMKGYVFVDPPGIEDDDELTEWVERCHRFVQSLPPKPQVRS